MSGKQELNAVLAKSEHSQNNKRENQSVLDNERGEGISPNKYARIHPYATENKTKQN